MLVLSLGLLAFALGLALFWEGISGLALVLLGLAVGLFIAWAGWARRQTPAGRRGAPLSLSGESGDIAEALDAAPMAAILVGRRSLVKHANRVALAEFPGLRIGEPLSFGLRNPVVLEAVAACQRDRIAQSTELVDKVPVERSYAVTASPLDGSRDEDTGPGAASVALFLQDTSGARRLDAMRSDFVANASHELRTPLASILGFIETLQGAAREDKAAQAKFLEIMAIQARRMARLVDDLLSLSRIEMKEHLAPAGAVDLVSLVGETIDALSGFARERAVTIKVDAPSQRLMVRGDRDDLLRVFDNLIENAIKYGRSGGQVDIKLAPGPGPDEAQARVRDYGQGISAEHLPRLTERFYRIDTTQSRAEGGTGLGLAIVKHIVNRHRGRLEIESREGEGACFTVTLPRAA